MNNGLELIGFDKDSKTNLELSAIEAIFLLNTIVANIEELKKHQSLDAALKLLLLQSVGQKLFDHIVPKDQQKEQLADSLLQALKQEEERKE